MNIEFTKMGYYCSQKETWYTDENDGHLLKIFNNDNKNDDQNKDNKSHQNA